MSDRLFQPARHRAMMQDAVTVWDGELRLCVALIQNAVEDLLARTMKLDGRGTNYSTSRENVRRLQHRQQAYRWLFQDNSQDACSFLWCCSYINMSAAWLRANLWREQGDLLDHIAREIAKGIDYRPCQHCQRIALPDCSLCQTCRVKSRGYYHRVRRRQYPKLRDLTPQIGGPAYAHDLKAHIRPAARRRAIAQQRRPDPAQADTPGDAPALGLSPATAG